MAKEKQPAKSIIDSLKQRGLTCSKLKSMERKQRSDARKARKDASMFRNFNIKSQADLQERIAQAEERSANDLKSIRRRLCPLK